MSLELARFDIRNRLDFGSPLKALRARYICVGLSNSHCPMDAHVMTYRPATLMTATLRNATVLRNNKWKNDDLGIAVGVPV